MVCCVVMFAAEVQQAGCEWPDPKSMMAAPPAHRSGNGRARISFSCVERATLHDKAV